MRFGVKIVSLQIWIWCIFIMKRKIYKELLEWKQNRSAKEAILIDGARRVGKSYIVEEFARNEYKSYILIDFGQLTDELREVFDQYLPNLDLFYQRLGLVTGVKLFPRESLIVFDEVQRYPKARQAIKHLVKDGRYDYIETGSLVSINKNVEGIIIPSEERHLNMHPMDFEEFLWAMGEDMLMDFVRQCFEQRKPLGAALHRKTLDYLRLYMIVGGMPQAVQEYIDSQDFEQVDQTKRNILDLYRSDIFQYAAHCADKVARVFDGIPSQLQKHEKKFRIGSLKKGARSRDYADAFFWLDESRTVNVCYAATTPNIGLKLNRDDSKYKVYLADTGLLISHAFDEDVIYGEQLYRKLMLGKLEVNKGMLVENLVAQMIHAAGKKLYFYSNLNKADSDDTMEIDFLVCKPMVTSRHNICPIEVKSSTRYTLSSINKFRRKFAEYLAEPFVLHSSDLMQKDGITYLPLYMAQLL